MRCITIGNLRICHTKAETRPRGFGEVLAMNIPLHFSFGCFNFLKDNDEAHLQRKSEVTYSKLEN